MDPIFSPVAGATLFDSAEGRAALEQDILPSYFPGCRWFGGKARKPHGFILEEAVPLGAAGVRLVLVRVEYADGGAETYGLPLRVEPMDEAPEGGDASLALIARFTDGIALSDALYDEGFHAELLRLIVSGGSVAGRSGEVVGITGSGLPAEAASGLPSRALKVEQSNSSIVTATASF